MASIQYNFTLSTDACTAAALTGNCSKILEEVAMQVGTAALVSLFPKVVDVLTQFGEHQMIGVHKNTIPHDLPVDDLKAMHAELRRHTYDDSLKDLPEFELINQTLWQNFEEAEPFVESFTASLRKEQEGGVLEPVIKVCKSIREIALDYMGSSRVLGTCHKCLLNVTALFTG